MPTETGKSTTESGATGGNGLRARLQAMQARVAGTWPALVVSRFFEYDTLALAAALAFYTMLSLAPLVVLLLWLTTSLYPSAQEEFFRQIAMLVGPQVESTARMIVANAESQPGTGSMAALVGTAALLFGASIVFAHLQTSLNRVFHSDAEQLGGMLAWLRKRLLSFGMAIAIGFLLVVSMIVQAGLAMLAAWLPDLLPVIISLFSFVLYSAVFAAMYRLLPDCPVDRHMALVGGALTAGMFMFGRWAIGLYLGQASLGSAYGPAGGLVVMLVWMYYSAVVFLAGALITSVLDERRQARKEESAGEGSGKQAPGVAS